jgi:hypothetical protein
MLNIPQDTSIQSDCPNHQLFVGHVRRARKRRHICALLTLQTLDMQMVGIMERSLLVDKLFTAE